MSSERGPDDTHVTVLLPVKTYEPAYLDEAVRSIVDQTSPRWRMLVVVEPGRKPLIEAVLASRSDPRIAVIVNDGRRLAGAINTGMRCCDTEFVGLIFADDLWAPNAVDVLEQYQALFPEVDFFHSSRRIVDDDGRPISSIHRARNDVTLSTFFECAPVKHLLCWRRSLALAIGGLDERSRSVGPDDFDFPWTMAEHGAVFAAVEECLYIYRDHRRIERLTTDIPLSVHVRELRHVLAKHGLDRNEVAHWVANARRGYLRQCRYRSTLERAVRAQVGGHFGGQRGPGGGTWRDSYS